MINLELYGDYFWIRYIYTNFSEYCKGIDLHRAMFNDIMYRINSVKVCSRAGREVDSSSDNNLSASRTFDFNAVASSKLSVKF